MSTDQVRNVSAKSSARLRALATLAVLLSFVNIADADVFTVGAVDPVPPAAGGTFSSFTQLLVGEGDDDTEGDIWGYVSVDDGTLLEYGSLIVGDEDGYFGQVNVTGNYLAGVNTQLNFSAQGSTTNPTVQIGREGTGWLNLSGGSTMTLTNSGGDMSIGTRSREAGHNGTGIGYTTVTDTFTILTVADNLYVGQNGIGSLDVLNGAIVRTLSKNTASLISIGTNDSGIGIVRVDGIGSVLRSASNLVVSGNTVASPTQFGQGTLRISNGGIVDVDNGVTFTASPTVTVGRLGRIELDDGTLFGFTPTTGFGITVNGYLGGAGMVRGSVDLRQDSSVEANPRDMLRFSGPVSNQGSITIAAGEIWFLNTFTNNAPVAAIPPGRISLEDGTVRFSQPLTNDGVISSARGSNNIHGAITNNERVFVARDSVATFYDAFVDNGTVTILPGGNALFLTDITFQSMATLNLGVGAGSLENTESPLSAIGVASLGGELAVELDAGYIPALGASYELLSADGGIVGTFDSVSLPELPAGLEFGLIYGANNLMMEVRTESVSINLPGDYNNDGIVDAADYTVWRNSLGSPNALPNDDSPGVGPDDYIRWKANFGQFAGSGAGSLAFTPPAVPEPASILLLVAAAPLVFGRFFLPRRPLR